MTERTVSLFNIPSIGRVEKSGLVVTVLLSVVNYLIGSKELAVGTATGGILFTANFMAIRFIVNALVAKFLFAKVDLFGFFIGVTGVVIVIIGESLRGSKDGTL